MVGVDDSTELRRHPPTLIFIMPNDPTVPNVKTPSLLLGMPIPNAHFSAKTGLAERLALNSNTIRQQSAACSSKAFKVRLIQLKLSDDH